MKTIFLISVLFSFVTHAEVNPLTNIFSLTKWDDLTSEVKTELSQFRKATFALDSNVENGMMCSGTYVTNRGHIITALHCIRECLWESLKEKHVMSGINHEEFFEKNLVYQFPDTGSHLSTLTMRPEDFQGLKCKMKVNGKTTELEFLGSGKGHLWPFFKSHLAEGESDHWLNLMIEGFGGAGDFALLKHEKNETPCVSLSTKEVRQGEKLRTLSSTCYMGYVHDKRNGKQVFYSQGKESSSLHSEYNDLKVPQIFTSTVSGEACSSGSLIIGEDGEAKGVMVQVVNYHSKLTTPQIPSSNISIAIKVPYILDSLKGHWGIKDDLTCLNRPWPALGFGI